MPVFSDRSLQVKKHPPALLVLLCLKSYLNTKQVILLWVRAMTVLMMGLMTIRKLTI